MLKDGVVKRVAVITHDNCLDGLGSYKAFEYFVTDNKLKLGIELFKLNFDKDEEVRAVDSILNNVYDYVIIMDYSLPTNLTKKLKSVGTYILNIDHHKFNEDKVKEADETVFDIEHSGAVLTWLYFNPEKDIPKILYYIEDRDIWNWKFGKDTDIYTSGLYTVGFEQLYKTPTEMLFNNVNYLYSIKMYGKGSVMYKDTGVDRIVKNILDKDITLKIDNVNYPAYNNKEFISEVCNKVANESFTGVAINWFITETDLVLSIRSINGKAGEIAKSLGGGGHPDAAGANIKLTDLDLEEFFINKTLVLKLDRD